MARNGSRMYLRGFILAISLITPIVAEESERIPGPARRASVELRQTKKSRWRRYVFSCEKCDGTSAPVTVYADYDGEGKMQGYREGRYRADRGALNEVGNDTISSLAVEEGFMVRLCQDEGTGRGAGRCRDFAAGQHNVPDEMDNETSFIWVWSVRR